jgi:hypothetical protein
MFAPLHINRAKLYGDASRDDLLRVFGSIADRLPPLAPGELLFVPKLQAKTKLRIGHNGSGFNDAVARELFALANDAESDPQARGSAKSYRFSSVAAFHAWLIGRWLNEGDQAIKPVLKSMGGYSNIRSWLRRVVLNTGSVLPEIVQILSRQGIAVSFAAALSPDDIVVAQCALGQAYGFRPEALFAPTRSLAQRHLSAKKRQATQSFQSLQMQAAAQPEWFQLRPEQRRFLLLVTDIAMRPSLERSAQYFAQLAAECDTPATHQHATAPSPILPIETAVTPIARKQPSIMKEKNRDKLYIKALQQDAAPTAQKIPVRKIAEPAAKLSASQLSEPDAPIVAAHDTELYNKQPQPEIQTRFGGIAFLINALLAIGLYPDFTQPMGTRLAMAPLRLIDRIALRWFGEEYRRDDMHELLRKMSADGALPSVWKAKPEWLQPFEPSLPGNTAFDGRRLTHWHPAGFPLYDRPLRSKDDDQLKAGAKALPNAQYLLPKTLNARWIACLTLYLDARTKQATGSAQLGLDALAITGNIKVQPQQIDWHFALEDLPLPLRLAGLDRNPGWLPAEGRSIAFHFQ